MSIKITSLLIAMIASATAINASVPIIVGYGKGRWAVMNLFTNAEDRLKHGDTAGAKRDLERRFTLIPYFGRRSTSAPKFTRTKASTTWL